MKQENNAIVKTKTSVFKREWFLYTARIVFLVVLFYLEWFISNVFHKDFCPIYYLIAIGACVLLMALPFLKDESGCSIFRLPNNEIVKRLFENVTGGDLFTFVLLLFFLIHLELIYFNVTETFYEESEIAPWTCIYRVLINMITVSLSLFLYPRKSKGDKVYADRKLMVSGLSSSKSENGGLLNFRNIDLLIKPIVSGKFTSLEKLIIIPSAEIAMFKMDTGSRAKGMFVEYCQEKSIPIDRNTYDTICDEINEGPFDLKKAAMAFLPYLDTKGISKEQLEKLHFDILDPMDYDDFPNCVNRIDDILKTELKVSGYKTGDTLLYINPGTGVIGSALSAFAIPGSRLIVYVTQLDKKYETQVFDVMPEGLSGIVSEIAKAKLE